MRSEKLSNNNGNEFRKRHRSVGQKVEIANTLHTILCKNEPSSKKPQKQQSRADRTQWKEEMKENIYAILTIKWLKSRKVIYLAHKVW